ncbi:MAG: LysR family transcriptional regulator [Spirochaetaceae bacterium]|jgi:molybdate transport system regulatory protein|nr:LysR family transcriptional regulator [Spirochaetaceae bacterium]GMO20709.1 MAG: hypothetical protein Pg6A_07540 [Termitinemataceae bacterium]
MTENIKPVTKVFLASPGGHGEPFLGPGMIKLLVQINETNNVRKACENMGLSYSKGWKLLARLENCIDFQVVSRRQGGAGGGDTRLTEEGAEFLKKHLQFESECEKAVLDLFRKYYA